MSSPAQLFKQRDNVQRPLWLKAGTDPATRPRLICVISKVCPPFWLQNLTLKLHAGSSAVLHLNEICDIQSRLGRDKQWQSESAITAELFLWIWQFLFLWRAYFDKQVQVTGNFTKWRVLWALDHSTNAQEIYYILKKSKITIVITEPFFHTSLR